MQQRHHYHHHRGSPRMPSHFAATETLSAPSSPVPEMCSSSSVSGTELKEQKENAFAVDSASGRVRGASYHNSATVGGVTHSDEGTNTSANGGQHGGLPLSRARAATATINPSSSFSAVLNEGPKQRAPEFATRAQNTTQQNERGRGGGHTHKTNVDMVRYEHLENGGRGRASIRSQQNVTAHIGDRLPQFVHVVPDAGVGGGGGGAALLSSSRKGRSSLRITPPPPVLCEENLKKLGRLNPNQRIVEDPGVYRPSTPILEWMTPKRSAEPPLLPMWLVVSAFCSISMVLTGIVPRWLSHSETTVFLCAFIPCFTVITAFVVYMSITRHLQAMVALMSGINNPADIDRVVEKLENGRFSRLREPWFVQVHTIRMFCRILKYHHGVNPISGELMNPHSSKRRRSAAYRSLQASNDQDEWTFSDGDGSGGAIEKGHGVNEGGVRRGGGGLDDENATSELESAAVYSCFSTGKDGGVTSTASVVGGLMGGSCNQPLPQTLTHRRPSSPLGARRLRSADPLGDNAAGWEQVMGSPPENKNLIFEILRQIKPGMEMSKIPLPAHILEPRSVLERISDMFTHPDLFGAIAKGGNSKTSRERLIAILRWYLSSLHVRPRGLKKPYNPVLGETFECVFARGKEDEVCFFAEQVGHHPPVSVFTAVHTATGMSVTGSYVLKGRLVSPNCACINVDGRIELAVPLRPPPRDDHISSNPTNNKGVWHSDPMASSSSFTATPTAAPTPPEFERWTMSFPSIFISSLLTAPRIEAGGDIKFACPTSELTASITFVRKPFFGGSYDEVRGSICASSGADSSAMALSPSLIIKGKWTAETVVEDSHGSRSVLFNAETAPTPMRPFAPDTIFPSPSRAVWEKVTVALRNMDSETAQKEKNELEASQREVRRSREARGDEYLPHYFRIVNEKRGPAHDQWLYIGPALGYASGAQSGADFPVVRVDSI